MDPADRTLVIGADCSVLFAGNGDRAQRRGSEDLELGFIDDGRAPSVSVVAEEGNRKLLRLL